MVAKTKAKNGWATDGLRIPPLNRWTCSYCENRVSEEDQETKGGWFDYDNSGELGFIHLDCYTLSIYD